MNTPADIQEGLPDDRILRQNDEPCRLHPDTANNALLLLQRMPGGTEKDLLMNARAMQEPGYAGSELPTLSSRDIVPPGTMEKIQPEAFADLVGDAHGLVGACHQRKDGSTCPVGASTCTFPRGGKEVHLLMTRDIAELKQRELVLLEHEKPLRALITTTHDIVWETCRNERFGFISRHEEEIPGYYPEESPGRTGLEFPDPSAGEIHWAASLNGAAQGSGIAMEEESIFSKGRGKKTGPGLFLAREIFAPDGNSIPETRTPCNRAGLVISVPLSNRKPAGADQNESSAPAGSVICPSGPRAPVSRVPLSKGICVNPEMIL